MPTYVYACDACGNQFEKVQSFSDDPLRVCPCGQEGKVRRVFQPVGIVFKGSGWYLTDSRKSDTAGVAPGETNGKADAKSDAGVSASTEKTSDTKGSQTTSSDSKPSESSAGTPSRESATSTS